MSKWILQTVRPDGSRDRNVLDREPTISESHGGYVLLVVEAMGHLIHMYISPYATAMWTLTEESDALALDIVEADNGRNGKEARRYAAEVWGIDDSE